MKDKKGEIKNLFQDKGYGFIKNIEDQSDVFFHFSKVQGDRASLTEGTLVTFDLKASQTKPGKMEAVNVRIVETAKVVEVMKTEDKYYLPLDTAKHISNLGTENTALKIQKFIRHFEDEKSRLKVKKARRYSTVEQELLKEQRNVLSR